MPPGRDSQRELETETRSGRVPWPATGPPRVPGLTVLCHPRTERVGDRVALTRLASGKEVLLSRVEPGLAAPGSGDLRPLADVHLSRRPLRLVPAPAPAALRLVAAEPPTDVEVDGEKLSAPREISAAELERGVVLLLARRIVLLLHWMDPAPPTGVPCYQMVGESAGMIRVRQQIQQVADLDVPVLLRGETGTGKELVAGAIHGAGPRRKGPYCAVNMAAIPASLAAAELFGVAKGAFTGADGPRKGYFRSADRGSLFLDEVGEIPAEVQVTLLRVLETGEIQSVGADRPRRVDVRLVAATDSRLEEAIEAGRFRAPLLHRLAGYEIAVPPLRYRRDDFGRLFYFFLRRELDGLGESRRLDEPGPDRAPWLPAPLVARLAAHPWPGNVRQLRNVARELAISSRGGSQVRLGPQIERLLAEGPEPPRDAERGAGRRAGAPGRRYRKPSEVSEEELIATLRANRWRLKPTAAQIGVSRTSLYALIERSSRARTAAELAPGQIATCFERFGGDVEAMVDELEVSRDALTKRLKELGLA